MTDKKSHNKVEDEFIHALFSNFSPEQPPENLAKNSMSEIFHEWSLQPATSNKKMSLQNKIWISLGIACCLVLVFVFDIQNIDEQNTITESLQIPQTTKIFHNLFANIIQSIKQVPYLVYIIFLGTGTLLLTDRVFSKIFKPT